MIDLITARGYEEPCLHQLAVFLPNRVGELGDTLRHLKRQGVGLHGLSVADSVDFAVIRLVVDGLEAARKVLKERRITVTESLVLAVELADEKNGVLDVCRALIRGEVNLQYAYPLITRPRGYAVLLVNVDDLSTGTELLLKAGFELLADADLGAGEEPTA